MPIPRMTTRTLLAVTVVAALSLALLIQRERSSRREAELRTDYEQRLTASLLELRDLRTRELVRLEENYLSLFEMSNAFPSRPATDPKFAAAKAELEKARADLQDVLAQLKAPSKRAKGMRTPGPGLRPPASTKPTTPTAAR